MIWMWALLGIFQNGEGVKAGTVSLTPYRMFFLQFENEIFPTILWPFCGANSAFLDVAIYASISVIR